MTVLIDNFDSFTYNLYQMCGEIDPEIRVLRNTAAPEEVAALQPTHILLSPGPGKPSAAGHCAAILRHFQAKVPILGVCLGHQVICETYGGVVGHAARLMHGKQSMVLAGVDCPLFNGLPKNFCVARYHSLAADPERIPDCLAVCARTAEDEVMAVRHRQFPVFGMQFHPESILTKGGARMLQNFLAL